MPGYGFSQSQDATARMTTGLRQQALPLLKQRADILEKQTPELQEIIREETLKNYAVAVEENDKYLSQEEQHELDSDREWTTDNIVPMDENRDGFMEQLGNDFERCNTPQPESAPDEGKDDTASETGDFDAPQPFNYLNDDGEDDNREMRIPDKSPGISLREHLTEQWEDGGYPSKWDRYAEQIVSKLSRNGYFNSTLADCAQEIVLDAPDCDVKKVMGTLKKVWNVIRGFDPAGVAAADLADCYRLQIQRKIKEEPDYYPPEEQELLQHLLQHADVLKRAFDAYHGKIDDTPENVIVKGLRKAIGAKLDILTEENADDAFFAIRSLNPFPGQGFRDESEKTVEYVYAEPEVEVTISKTTPRKISVISLLPPPHLYKSRSYMNIYNDPKTPPEVKREMKEKFDRIDTLNGMFLERGNAITHLTRLIVKHQREYFLSGNREKLVPMTETEIAKEFSKIVVGTAGAAEYERGVDTSYISRLAGHAADKGKKDTRKYMKTPYGTLPFEFFFGRRDTGNGVTTREQIVDMMVDIINNPPPGIKIMRTGKIPDEQITQELNRRLQECGEPPIQRRTVSKYRKELGRE